MADYILPSEIRPFEQQFYKLHNAIGDDYLTLFEAFLDFFINGFNIEGDGTPMKGWKYNTEQNKMFYELFSTYILLFDKMINRSPGWYDMFGDFFMAVICKSSQQYRGQFFTPQHICDFMARVTIGEDKPDSTLVPTIFGQRHVVSDPTCGSGRLLLAAHTVFCEKNLPGRYFVGEDIDRLCAKMTAVNMCMHGCLGEVVCHDSLCHPEEVFMGFIINEGLGAIGLPTIRKSTDPNRFLCTRIARQMREEHEAAPVVVEPPKPEASPKPALRQLSLFDFDGFA